MKYFICIVIVLLGLSISYAEENSAPKKIIVVIANGLGREQISLFVGGSGVSALAEYFGTPKELQRLDLDFEVADNAAAGTAIFSGMTTLNGYWGITPYVETPEEKTFIAELSIAEYAASKGWNIGMISDVDMWQSMLPALYLHQERISAENLWEESQLVDFSVSGMIPPRSGRSMAINEMNEEVLAQGYIPLHSASDMANLAQFDPDNSKYYLLSNGGFLVDNHTANSRFTLEQGVVNALDILSSSSKPFLLVVEAANLDVASHANDAATLYGELKGLSAMLHSVHNYYNEHQEETLLLVVGTGDTGELQLNQVNYRMLENQSKSWLHIFREVSQLGEDAKFEEIIAEINKYSGNAVPASGYEAWRKIYDASNSPSRNALVTIAVKNALTNMAGVSFKSSAHSNTPALLFKKGTGANSFSDALVLSDVGDSLKQLIKAY